MMRAHGFGLLLLVLLVLLGTSGCFGGLDECDIGATSCSNGIPAVCYQDCSDLSCTNKWQLGASCGATQTCIAPSDAPPMCVESPSKDPLCAGAASATYCLNQQLALCDHGYRSITRACGSGGISRALRTCRGGARSPCASIRATALPPASPKRQRSTRRVRRRGRAALRGDDARGLRRPVCRVSKNQLHPAEAAA